MAMTNDAPISPLSERSERSSRQSSVTLCSTWLSPSADPGLVNKSVIPNDGRKRGLGERKLKGEIRDI
jgi:hypothetical protein